MGGTVEPGKAKSAGIVGIIILVVGLAKLICGCIMTSYGEPSASGIWTGVLMMITGGLGILAWGKKEGNNKIAMVFYLVLNILGLVLVIVQLVIALIGWLVWHVIRKIVESKCTTYGGYCHCTGSQDVPIKTLKDCGSIYIIESCFCAIVILCGIGAVVMLAGSIIGCMATCCAKDTQTTQVVVVQQPGIVMHTQAVAQSPPVYGQQQKQ